MNTPHWDSPEGKKIIKKRYFKKIYDNAPMIKCSCGCGATMKSKDKYGRDSKYLRGHGGRKYDDPTEYKKAWNRRNKKKLYQNKKNYNRKRKIQLIKLKGNKCKECNLEYNGQNACIFDLHHRDPKEKKFLLNMGTFQNIAFSKCLEEVEKCDLLCSNCHRLLHTGGW